MNYAESIYDNINFNREILRNQFNQNIQSGINVRYCILDDLLPHKEALELYSAFPNTTETRFVSSFREKKYTSKNFDSFNPILKKAIFSFQYQKTVKLIDEITNIKNQEPDPSLYAGGLSIMGNSHFLNPHIDNSHDNSRRLYRTLNLLYYVTPDWVESSGGHLELWDPRVVNKITIESKFNRLVIMETTPHSWHSVSPVLSTINKRCCLSNYYFSQESPTRKSYFNVTSFTARPNQHFLRAYSRIDNGLRNSIRFLVKSGIGRTDLYNLKK